MLTMHKPSCPAANVLNQLVDPMPGDVIPRCLKLHFWQSFRSSYIVVMNPAEIMSITSNGALNQLN